MNDLIIIAVLFLILVFSLMLVFYLHKQNAPLRTSVMQFGSSIVFLLIVFLLAYINKIGDQTLATLLGAYVGYVFGKVASKGEWGN